MNNPSDKNLLKELEFLKAENERLKQHSHFFEHAEKVTFKSFEESNQNLHEFFDNANDLIQVFSLDERLLFVNESWVQTLKYSKKKAEKLELSDIIHPDYIGLVKESLKLVREGKNANKTDFYFIDAKGNKIPVVGSFSCIYEHDEIVGYTGIFYDNSEKVKAERAQKLYYQIANLSIEYDKLEKLLEEIHHLLREHIFANNFHVALQSEVPDLLTFPYYVDENFGGRVKSYSRRFGKGLSEYTIRTKKPQFLKESDIKQLIKEEEVEIFKDIPKIWLGVPLKMNNDIIGVIVVKSHSDPKKYKKQDIDLLNFISGQIALVIGRRQYEDQIIEQRAKLKAVVESSQHIIWSIDRDHYLTSFNENYAKLVFENYGIEISPDELKKRKLYRFLLSGLEYDDFIQYKYDLAFEGEVQHFETKSTSATGQTIWRETYLSPIFLPNGKIDEVSGISHDITEKKLQELTVLESEEKFRSIFESLQDIFVRTDLQGKITMISPSIESLTGYTPDELIGESIHNFYQSENEKVSIVQELLSKGKILNHEAKLSNKFDKEVYSIANLKTVINTDKRIIGFDGVVRDITFLKKSSEELERARDLAEHSLKVKDQFLANMSHEIRTPMNGLIAMIDLLADTRLDEEQTDYVHTVKNSSSVLLDLLNDILDLAKLQAGKMELHTSPVRILNTFEKIHALFYQKAKSKGLDFNFEVSTDLEGHYFIDETRLIQVLSNLTSNSVKFTDNGSVKIRATLLAQKKEFSQLKFEVIDTGIGIHKEDIPKLFHNFNQLDNSTTKAYSGTGLGLSISKDLVDLMEGEIKVESKINQGSKFWFTINVKPVEVIDQVIETTPFKISDNQFKDSEPKILVVDDNSVNRKVAKAILLKAGCKVRTAKNGFDAISAVKKSKFDIVFMDIQMPELDGLSAMQRIHSLKLPNTPPIIAMTAYSLTNDKEKFLKEGFDGYISKPITAEKLLSFIKGQLASLPQTKGKKTTKVEIISQDIWNKLNEYGGLEMKQELYNEFFEQTSYELNQCHGFIKEENHEEIVRIIHTLKGTGATIGASKISKTAKEIEAKVREGNFHNFEEDVDLLQSQLKELKKKYKELISNE